MSWPYTPDECPRCRYFERLEPPLRDDAGYPIVGPCGHPRIAMELFRMRSHRNPGHGPCFLPLRPSQRGLRR
jgi:hypothetical protein